MPTTKPKIQKKTARGKTKSTSTSNGTESKLISIRIPRDTLDHLKNIAGKKGDLGYQQLIKSYISESLTREEEAVQTMTPDQRVVETGEAVFDTSRAKARIAKTLESVKINRKGSRRNERGESEIIKEDIRLLADHLKNYHSFFEGKTFLITGAFGFLGRYMVSLLKYLNDHVLKRKARALLLDNFVTGYEQTVISDKNLVFHKHNVIEPFEPNEPVDYVIHAAGIASPVYYTKFPIETMDVGTVGTRNMLEMAYRQRVKSFLFTSSSEVYGDPDPAHVPTQEDYTGQVSIVGPRSCYDESKRFGETMCLAFWNVYNVPVKTVRPFNVYGPGIRPDDFRVLPNFIEHALRREPLPIHGDGINTRSFCYINDAVEALFRILFSEENGEAFNIGNPYPELSVQQLGNVVAGCMPFDVDVVNIDPPHAVYAKSDPKRRCPDISKLTQRTGFKPRYSLEEGLTRTIQWFCEV